VRGWPPINEPDLLERLALGDEEFIALMQSYWSAAEPRELEPAAFERALGYPWERPGASYILHGEEVELLGDIDPGNRAEVVADFARDRHPLLSFGGNGAPSWLATKFAHFTEEADREVLVLTGELHDFDVGVAPTLSPIGYMPAVLFASPGTAVRAAVVWATPAQATQLTWTEVPYRLGRLDDAHFVIDEADIAVDEIFAYIHRLGSFCVEGSQVALAAIPARDRTATPLTQEQLLDIAARMVVGPDAGAEDLVRALYGDLSGVGARVAETVWPSATPLQSRWTPFPQPSAAPRLGAPPS
jgi:hypothetical protein